MLPCQAIMKKQSGSLKPFKSAAVLQAQDQASCYVIAVIVIEVRRAFEKTVPARFGRYGFYLEPSLKNPNFENHWL